jgi:EAL domain-containing protein (putative c-di-GMP-specific phosphodiesterase class I)
MKSAFQTLSQWDKQGIVLNQFSINVSMRQFFYYDFVNNVNDLCEQYLTEETRHKVVFEVTESVVAEDVDSVIQIMYEIRKLGIRFSMDDFGTGYSSLSYLKCLPISEIKIDRSFISEIDKEENDQMMVHSILNMANHFDLTVVAEGIESKEQLNFLKANKCELYQGFLFSKPVTEDEFKALIKQ